MQFQLEIANDEVQGFTLYGMKYRHGTDAMGSLITYKVGEKLECIQYSDDAREALRRSLLKPPIDMLGMETLALQLMSVYLAPSDAVVAYYGNPTVMSTARGSVIIVTEYGELLGAVLNHSSDIFLVRKLLSKYQKPKTWAEVGSPMYCTLTELWNVPLTQLIGDTAEFEDYHPESPYKVDIEDAIKGLNLTLWELSK